MADYRFTVQGMRCTSCAVSIEKAVAKLPGVESAIVNFAAKRLQVRGSEGLEAAVTQTLQGLGYGVNETAPTSTLRWRVLLSALLTAPFLLGLPPWGQCLFATAVQLGIAFPLYRSAGKSLLAGSANMDLLVVLGTSAAYGLSLYNLLTGQLDQLYFEGAAILITFILLGRLLEDRAMRRASNALHPLDRKNARRSPTTCACLHSQKRSSKVCRKRSSLWATQKSSSPCQAGNSKPSSMNSPSAMS